MWSELHYLRHTIHYDQPTLQGVAPQHANPHPNTQ